jgi:myo-inositol-1(or 4)-monophosphatase
MARIHSSLEVIRAVFNSHKQPVHLERKSDGSSLTELDIAVCTTLRAHLLKSEEGWVSEEDTPLVRTSDDKCIWVVDPIDGTREYVEGIPEYAVSIAAWVNDTSAAGLIFNPITEQIFSGGFNSTIATADSLGSSSQTSYHSEHLPSILVSRSEIESSSLWNSIDSLPYRITPCGSIAYKLGLMATGHADAVVSLAPKSSWDIAAGTILIKAAGGFVTDLSGNEIEVQKLQRVNGIIAGRSELRDSLLETFAV